MSSTVEEYVEKIGRITSEYKQLSRSEVEFNDDGENSPEEIKERKISIYKYIKRKAVKCEDKRIAMATLEFTPKMFKYLPETFKHDKEFFLYAMKELEAPKLLKYADRVIRSDLECCLEAVRMDYRLFPAISSKLQSNPEIINVYEWGLELSQIPKNLPEIDLSAYGPDEDDKFFKIDKDNHLLEKNQSPQDSIEAAIEQLEEESEDKLSFPNIATVDSNPASQKSNRTTKNKTTKSTPLIINEEVYTEATIDWETEGAVDDDFDEDDEPIKPSNKVAENDPDLPPVKKKKKGFFAKLFG